MKKTTIFLLIALAIFFTSTLVLLYLYFYKPLPTSTFTPTTGVIPTETINPTADWKIYTNTKYGFSLEYPSDANTTSRDPNPFPVAIQIENLKPRTGGGGGPEVEGWFMTISETQSNANNLTLTQWAREKNLITGIVTTNTSIGGQPAIHWNTTGGDVQLSYYLIKRNTGMTLILINDNSFKNQKIIDQIFSTIKFIEPITNWKTYINKTYNFSFEYPNNWDISEKTGTSTHEFSVYADKLENIAALKARKQNTEGPVFPFEFYVSTTEVFYRGNSESDLISETNTIFAGKKAIKYQQKLLMTSMNGNEGDILTSIVIPVNQVYFVITQSRPSDNPGVFDQILSTFKFTEISNSLIPADSDSPAAGICDTVTGQMVTITIGEDNTSAPRCVKVTSSQKLSIINNSLTSTEINLSNFPKITIQPGKTYSFSQTLGSFLAPGVHQIGGAEIWLK